MRPSCAAAVWCSWSDQIAPGVLDSPARAPSLLLYVVFRRSRGHPRIMRSRIRCCFLLYFGIFRINWLVDFLGGRMWQGSLLSASFHRTILLLWAVERWVRERLPSLSTRFRTPPRLQRLVARRRLDPAKLEQSEKSFHPSPEINWERPRQIMCDTTPRSPAFLFSSLPVAYPATQPVPVPGTLIDSAQMVRAILLASATASFPRSSFGAKDPTPPCAGMPTTAVAPRMSAYPVITHSTICSVTFS